MVQTTGFPSQVPWDRLEISDITNNDSGHPGFTRASRDAAALLPGRRGGPSLGRARAVRRGPVWVVPAEVPVASVGVFQFGGPLKEGFLRKHQPLNRTETLLVG